MVSARLIWVGFAMAAACCQAADVPVLLPPFARDGGLAPNQHADYRIAVPAGHSVEISLRQFDATLQLRATSGADTPLPLMQNDAGRQARWRLTLIADRAAVWSIDITPTGARHAAHFRLRVGNTHPTRPVDRLRAMAEQSLAQAEVLRRQAGSLEQGKRPDAGKSGVVVATYQAALKYAQRADDACLQLMANSDLARYEFSAGQYAQARDSEVAALKFRCGPDSDPSAAAEAAAQRTLGAALGYLGDFTAAIAAKNRALTLYRQTGDTNYQSMVLGNMSADYRVTGATHEAMATAKAALGLAPPIGNRRRALFARESIAAILMQRGEWGKAREAYRAVLDALRTSPYPMIEGMTWTDLGQVYWELHDPIQSRLAFARAEAMAAKAGDLQGLADTRLDEADIDFENQRIAAACAIFRDNLDFDIKHGLQREQAHALIGLGQCAGAGRDWTATRKSLADALDLAHKIGAIEFEISAYQALGDLDDAQHLGRQAAANYDRGYALALRANDVNSRIVLLGSRARVALESGDAQAANKLIAPAIDLIENEQAQIDAPSLRTHYFASLRAYYGLYIDVLMQLDREHPGKGYAVDALQVSEQARARALRDQLLARNVDVAPRADPKLIAAVHAAEDDLRQAAWRLAQLPADAAASLQKQAQHDVDEASSRLDDARGRVRGADPRYAELAYPSHFDLAWVQHHLLDDKVVVYEYWLDTAHAYRWRITRNSVSSSVLPARSILEKSAAALRASILVPGTIATDTSFAARARALATADTRLRQQAAALGKILLPATDKDNHRTRVIVAEGELQRIPFDLLDAGGGHDYVYLPSLATLAELRAEPPATQRAPSLAVFADPVFSADDPRLRHHAGDESAPLLADSPLREASADIGIDSLSRLPYSHVEADAIAALVPADDRWVATGFDANRASALAADWPRYTLVDFATHSLIDMRHPELSGVVLSLYDARGHREDGVLRMQDIYNLRMPADLVTLSVCDSSREPELGAEGSFGLSRAFFYAGVRRLVVSLWPVDDRASAQLMTLFYDQLLRQRQSPQAALQSAQAQLRRDPRWRAPFYWAGFVVQGDWL